MEEKVELVRRLLEQHNLTFQAIMSDYPFQEFYLKLLGIKPGWTYEDEVKLEQMTKGTRHHRNWRTLREYASELILGWILQDLTREILRRKGFEVHRTGTDASRELLKGSLVKEEPDLQLITPKDIWHLDLITDYPKKNYVSFWKKHKRCHLRDKKFERLKEQIKPGHRAGIIGIVVVSAEYFALEIKEDTPAIRIESHWAYGRKPAYELRLGDLGVEYYPLNELPRGLPL